MMMDFGKITSPEDLDSYLEQLEAEEKDVVNEIDELLKNEHEYEAIINGLVKHITNISMLESDAERLSNLMNFTLTLAENVNYKIRSFNNVKDNVSDCLKQVEDIIDLRSCTAGIQKSLLSENYEDAARHIYRFLSMDESMLRKASLQNLNDPNSQENCSLEQSLSQLHEAQDQLQKLLLRRFDESVEKNDIKNIERFFKIFPLIKLHKMGLEKFSSYLCRQLLEKMNAHSKIDHGPNETKISTLLLHLSFLFETIAQMIEQYHPLIETFYGPGKLYHFIIILQQECNKQTQAILNDFKNEKNFQTLSLTITKLLKNMNSSNSLLNTAQSSNTGGSSLAGNVSNNNRIDSKDIDCHLNDIMIVINRIQTYLDYIKKKLLSDCIVNSNSKNDNQSQNPVPVCDSLPTVTETDIEELLRNCQLTQIMHDINSFYVLLCEYFLKESIFKAIQIDVLDKNDNVIITSLLDDIFFIIKKCFKMSISTGSVNVVLAMINNCVAVLETTYYDIHNERIKYGYFNSTSSTTNTLDLSNAYNAIQSGRYLQSSNEIEKKNLLFIGSLNNLDISCDYIELLTKTITDDSIKMNILQKNNMELFNSCLNEFQSITSKFRSLISIGIQSLFNSVFKSTVKTMIDSFVSLSHVLSENDIYEYEATDGIRLYLKQFFIQFSGLVSLFRKQLTGKNFDSLLIGLIHEISTRLYKSIFKCTFNKFGGFQFDREIRAIMKYFSELSYLPLREYFTKLKFVCAIFTLSNIDEIQEYIRNDSNINSLRINPNEIHQLLRLYVELSVGDIKRFKL